MKIKHFVIASALLVSAAGSAQKDEMKTLKKLYAIEQPTAKDVAEYKAALVKAEPLVANSTESDKIYLDFYKAMTPILEWSVPENQNNPQFMSKNVNPVTVTKMATALNTVLDYEKKTGKKIYTDDINETITSFKPTYLNVAVTMGNQNMHKEASALLYAIYQLDKKDADNLYYAASYAVNGQDYANALKYYDELKTINYTGEKVVYYATNLASDSEESFATKADRDKMIGLKTHRSPREQKEESKRGEIYKNTAMILIQQGKANEAKEAIANALKENPNDQSLMLSQADLYLQLKDTEGYKRIVNQILEKNPNDADLNFNVGVISLQANQLADAEKSFTRAIEINPKYTNAHINLAVVKLKGDDKLVEEMNKLTTSAKDNKRYEELKAERIKLFKSILPHLEKANELEPGNQLVIENLLSVYSFLEMTDKYKALKALKK